MAALPILNLLTTVADITANVTNQHANIWYLADYHDGQTVQRFPITLSLQGDSSTLYPKKNFKLRLFTDEQRSTLAPRRFAAHWPPMADYTLKANLIDATQSRNLVCAQLVREVSQMRAPQADTPDHLRDRYDGFYRSGALGQIQGLPVIVQVAGRFYGLYTLNTADPQRLYAPSPDNQRAFAVYVRDNGAAGQLRQPAAARDQAVFGSLFSPMLTEAQAANWEDFVTFVATADPERFRAKIADYVDVIACLDNLIVSDVLNIGDTSNKSNGYVTYNGTYFIPILYDLDQALGQFWTIHPGTAGPLSSAAGNLSRGVTAPCEAYDNLLYARIAATFPEALHQRYWELRRTVLAAERILARFEAFIAAIPPAVYAADHAAWAVPNADCNDFGWLQHYLITRLHKTDADYSN